MRPALSVSFIALLLGFIVTASACKRHSTAPLPADAVLFDSAGVALVPGEDWKPIREQGFPATIAAGELCLPVLRGEKQFDGALIQVYLDRGERSNPKRAAEKLVAAIEKNPDLLKTSLRRETFSSEQGISGVHLSYNQKMELPTRKWLARTHLYIIQNKRRQIVAVCYVTIADRESPAVREMIRQTLSVR